MKLDLDERRDLSGLLVATWALFRAHATVFFTMTLLVVAPFVIAVDGVWGRQLADGPDAKPSTAAGLTALVLSALVITPVVTALQVVTVQAIARGEEPRVGSSLRAAAGRLPAAILTVLLASIGIAAGFVLLIVPGVYLAIRWYVAAQAAVVDRLPPVAAIRRSGELVRGHWLDTFGRLLVAGLLFGIVTALLGVVAQGVGAATGSGPIYVSLSAIVQSVALSLSAIFATLLFFDLRARKEPRPA